MRSIPVFVAGCGVFVVRLVLSIDILEKEKVMKMHMAV